MTAGNAIQAVLGVAILSAGYLYWTRRDSDTPQPPAREYPELAAFRASLVDLPSGSDGATAFLDAAQTLFTTFRDASAQLDAKATTLLGFVGGGSSVIAFLSGNDKLVRPNVSPLLILATASLVAVLYHCLRCLHPRISFAVNVSQLCDVNAMCSPDGKTKINALLGYEYLESAREMVPIAMAKARRLERAYLAFAVGVIAIVANAAIATPDNAGKDLPVNCTTAAGTTHCNVSIEVKP